MLEREGSTFCVADDIVILFVCRDTLCSGSCTGIGGWCGGYFRPSFLQEACEVRGEDGARLY